MSSFFFPPATPTIVDIPPSASNQNYCAQKKIIYLIRHAESEENVKMYGFQEVGMSIYDGRVPSSKDLSSSLSFLSSVV